MSVLSISIMSVMHAQRMKPENCTKVSQQTLREDWKSGKHSSLANMSPMMLSIICFGPGTNSALSMENWSAFSAPFWGCLWRNPFELLIVSSIKLLIVMGGT